MASRRDELNAYTFAKRRLVAQFVQPNPTGTEEGAPRPLRGFLPGLVVGVVVLAVFGAWGMFSPKAPKDWDKPKEKIIVGSESMTTYVVLTTDGRPPQLHPVLNLASAKLLLSDQSGDVVKVDEKILDAGKPPRGPLLGIPYAPDRLPDPKDAGTRKRWAVCETVNEGGSRNIRKAAFVLNQREERSVEGRNRLRAGELMYVEGPDHSLHVVDHRGKRYRLPEGEAGEPLRRQVVGQNKKPQRVSKEWLNTTDEGDPITFPEIKGTVGAPANVPGLSGPANKVGMILTAPVADGTAKYLVLPGRVAPVSDFMANLLLSSPDLKRLDQTEPTRVPPVEELGASFGDEKDWPKKVGGDIVNDDGHDTFCNVLRDVHSNGKPDLSTWSGKNFPLAVNADTTTAHVSPGSGQLFRQYSGRSTKEGTTYLVTDTGLRYALRKSKDSDRDDSGIGTERKSSQREAQRDEDSQRRLGYGDQDPTPVPAAWASYLPLGPVLSNTDARQPQGS
ncbi:type VII secretion protein EccB [Streptomyces sp. NPDC005438]|uniref:type VII secretion protein EccB n=1 Tax=Streptomyces sp. NPDC005438 TaxID=3156880 RepID=UPI0033AAEE24